MRRAVILVTLTLLLLAVAGVTAARENTFTSISQGGDQTESTAPEPTVPESAAPEATVPEATAPEAIVPETTAREDLEKPDEGAVEATVVVPGEPKEPGKGDPPVVTRAGVRDDNGNEVAGEPAGKPAKPEHPQVGKKNGKLRDAGGPPVKARPDTGRPADAGEAGVKGSGGNPGKVTLCHKDRVTISVGAPAEPAHLRHGDSLGAC